MRAIQVRQFGDPDVLQIAEITGASVSDVQIKVEVHAIGVNPVDTYCRAGSYPLKPDLPYTPGNDAAGIITAIGKDVVHHKVGDRVYLFGPNIGTYAEEIICSQSNVYPLPDNVSFATGAAVGVPYTTAYYGLIYRGQAKPGDTVFIHGASGAVGQAAIQIANSYGMHVIGTAGTSDGIKLLQGQGVVAALNHHEANYLSALDELTCGVGPNVILEMLANLNLDKDLKVIAKDGRIVIIGNRGSIEINPRDTMGKNASIVGMAAFNASKEEMYQIHSGIYAGLADGRYAPVIRCEIPLSDAAKAHEMVMQPGGNGKIILLP